MGILAAAICRLEEAAETLVDRLAPVLAPQEGGKGSDEGKTPPPMESGLVREVRSQASRVNSVADVLLKTIDHLDLP